MQPESSWRSVSPRRWLTGQRISWNWVSLIVWRYLNLIAKPNFYRVILIFVRLNRLNRLLTSWSAGNCSEFGSKFHGSLNSGSFGYFLELFFEFPSTNYSRSEGFIRFHSIDILVNINRNPFISKWSISTFKKAGIFWTENSMHRVRADNAVTTINAI